MPDRAPSRQPYTAARRASSGRSAGDVDAVVRAVAACAVSAEVPHAHRRELDPDVVVAVGDGVPYAAPTAVDELDPVLAVVGEATVGDPQPQRVRAREQTVL